MTRCCRWSNTQTSRSVVKKVLCPGTVKRWKISFFFCSSKAFWTVKKGEEEEEVKKAKIISRADFNAFTVQSCRVASLERQKWSEKRHIECERSCWGPEEPKEKENINYFPSTGVYFLLANRWRWWWWLHEAHLRTRRKKRKRRKVVFDIHSARDG